MGYFQTTANLRKVIFPWKLINFVAEKKLLQEILGVRKQFLKLQSSSKKKHHLFMPDRFFFYQSLIAFWIIWTLKKDMERWSNVCLRDFFTQKNVFLLDQKSQLAYITTIVLSHSTIELKSEMKIVKKVKKRKWYMLLYENKEETSMVNPVDGMKLQGIGPMRY